MINSYYASNKYKTLCKCIKRKQSNEVFGKNEQLIYESVPSDVFRARQLGHLDKDSEIYQSQMEYPYETIVLETPDFIDLKKYDKVIYLGKEWLVEKTTSTIVLSSSEVMYKGGTRTTSIILRK